ncbi:hypothetical protein LTR36_007654 [Oleoguttula mirabilis]|uniref:Uncharacterized protein n=1 Tax=Oleoguttula mirabilis TaxID=1507867 RepID=A0AAV9JU13_9PEZI|nr:hypothetical protein LTR36_007654 [Oleoguttula mirabilis]
MLLTTGLLTTLTVFHASSSSPQQHHLITPAILASINRFTASIGFITADWGPSTTTPGSSSARGFQREEEAAHGQERAVGEGTDGGSNLPPHPTPERPSSSSDDRTTADEGAHETLSAAHDGAAGDRDVEPHAEAEESSLCGDDGDGDVVDSANQCTALDGSVTSESVGVTSNTSSDEDVGGVVALDPLDHA